MLARNLRLPGAELDIVTARGGVLHVIEVKARRHGAPYAPRIAYTTEKRRRIRRAASRLEPFLSRPYDRLSLDLAEVVWTRWGWPRVRYTVNADPEA